MTVTKDSSFEEIADELERIAEVMESKGIHPNGAKDVDVDFKKFDLEELAGEIRELDDDLLHDQ